MPCIRHVSARACTRTQAKILSWHVAHVWHVACGIGLLEAYSVFLIGVEHPASSSVFLSLSLSLIGDEAGLPACQRAGVLARVCDRGGDALHVGV